MIGAVAGDIIGSTYERHSIKTKRFRLFPKYCTYTDDTVLSIAIAKSILDNEPYIDNVIDFGIRYYGAGYGLLFKKWLKSIKHEPYNSWGNGSAMRVSAIGFAFDTEEEVLAEAKKSAEITHNHKEGIKGAEATALAIFMARKGADREDIREVISKRFNYNLDDTVDEIRPFYRFDVSCQGSVPQSIICFLDSTSYEDTIRNAISLGGDTDTMATIAGGIAEAYYKGVPRDIRFNVYKKLPNEFLGILEDFKYKYML
jgi:ADP-ribosylglycohydrolase